MSEFNLTRLEKVISCPVISFGGGSAIDSGVQAFIAQFEVPTRLQQLHVSSERALALADAVFEELSLFDAMRQPVTVEEIRELLREVHAVP
jgi:alcohol dehydrogenase class IV